MLRRLAAMATLLLSLFAGSVVAAPSASAAPEPTPWEMNDPALIGPDWTPMNIRTGASLNPTAHMQITWGNKLQGNDGCNDFWGRATVDGVEKRVTIEIDGMTRRACFVPATIDVNKDLVGPHTYSIIGGRLVLKNDAGSRTVFVQA